MNRRDFLLKSAGLLFGAFFPFNFFSKAMALEKPFENGSPKPRIALIIDDIGDSIERARQFLRINAPITFSILPCLPHSFHLAGEIHDSGHEVMLHQPMEPYHAGYFNPGPGAVYVSDNENRIKEIVEENIYSIPHAAGVNNHMGSRFTECKEKLKAALFVTGQKRLFFVDSRTSSNSIAYQTAMDLNIPATARNVFIDNVRNTTAILKQLYKLTSHAVEYGCAVGIGHPHPETVQAVKCFFTHMENFHVSPVYVSELLK